MSEKYIHRDSFQLFDLTEHQVFNENTFIPNKNEEIHFSYASFSAKIFYSPNKNKFFIGLCTESEFYINDVENNISDIIFRHLMLEIPRSFIIDGNPQLFLVRDYLQEYLDSFIIHKKHIPFPVFIFDNFANENLTRVFYPDEDTILKYKEYVLETERLFLNKNFNSEYSFVKNKEIKNIYFDVKKNYLEEPILPILSYSTLNIFELINQPLYQFKISKEKIFKNHFKTKMSFNFKESLFDQGFFNIKNFGALKSLNNDSFLYIETESSIGLEPNSTRLLLIPSNQQEVSEIYTLNDEQLFYFFKNKMINLNNINNIFILEKNYFNPHFDYLYSVNNSIIKEYFYFLSKPIDEKIFINKKNFSIQKNYIDINLNPHINLYINFFENNYFNQFNLVELLDYNKVKILVSLQNTKTIYSSVNDSFYFLNQLEVLNKNDFTSFKYFFSYDIDSKIIIKDSNLIGCLKRQRIFEISDIDYQILSSDKNLNNEFLIPDTLDKYLCKINQKSCFLDYLEFVDENNHLVKKSILNISNSRNGLKEAQSILSKFH